MWNAQPDSLAVAKVGPDFIYKSTSVVTRVGTNMQQSPWIFAPIIVVLILLLALGVRAVLRRRGEKLGDDNDSDA